MKKIIRNLSKITIVALLTLCICLSLVTPVAYAANESSTSRTITITNENEFLEFVTKCVYDEYSKNLTVKLESDLDFSRSKLMPIPIFTGTFLGQGHTISGVNFVVTGSKQGFIRYLTEGAVVQDLNLNIAIVSDGSAQEIGGLVGNNAGLIKNVTVNGEVTGTAYVGGIVGRNLETGSVRESENNAEIFGDYSIGGIAGINSGNIRENVNNGKVNNRDRNVSETSGIMFAGGVAGYNLGTVYNNRNYGAVGFKDLGKYVGGVTGVNFATVSECINEGAITGTDYVGGMSGYYGKISAELNQETKEAIDKVYEEIFGLTDKKFEMEKVTTADLKLNYCYNNGTIIGKWNVGGIAGVFQGKKEVSTEKPVEGGTGVTAKNSATIENCFNEGTISAKGKFIGGIVGQVTVGIVEKCYEFGLINANDKTDFVGGIVGDLVDASVLNCFVFGDISGKDNIGGIAGRGDNIRNTYSNTSIKCYGEKAGGVAGYSSSMNQIENNFYVENGFAAIDGISYKNKAEPLAVESFASQSYLPTKLTGFSNAIWTVGKNKATFPMLDTIMKVGNPQLREIFTERMIENTKYAFSIVFVDETEIVDVVKVPYGEDLDVSLIPKEPTKDGYFLNWEVFDTTNIEKNVTVNLIYEKGMTTLASKDGSNDLLVEGLYRNGSTLEVKDENTVPAVDNKKLTFVGGYSFEIIDKNGEKIPFVAGRVRVKMPEDVKNVAIGVVENGDFKTFETEVKRGYVTAEINSSSFVILEVKKEFYQTWWFITIVSILGFVAISFVVVKIYKKYRKLTLHEIDAKAKARAIKRAGILRQKQAIKEKILKDKLDDLNKKNK